MEFINETRSPIVISLNRYNVITLPEGRVNLPEGVAAFVFNYMCEFIRARGGDVAVTFVLNEKENKELGCKYGDDCFCRKSKRVVVASGSAQEKLPVEADGESETVEKDEEGSESKEEAKPAKGRGKRKTEQ